MKILLLGLPALKSAFQELGHEVLTCTTDGRGDICIQEIPISMDRLLQYLPFGWNPDFVLLVDDSTHPLFLGLERLDIPVGWYAIDSHIHHRWHQAYATVFDLLFIAQRDFVPGYVRDASRQVVHWLPLFCHSIPSKTTCVAKQHDLCFVGSVNRDLNPVRCRFLEALQQAYPIYVATGDWVSVYQESKMVLNQCVGNDVNFRTFEAMVSGSLLLMERVGNGLEELFQDRAHCVMYEKGNIEHVIELANYYAAHDEEREAIALQGRSEVLAKHTGIHRASTILNVYSSIDHTAVLQQRRLQQGEILYLLASVYAYVANCYHNSKHRSPDNVSLFHRRVAVAERFRHVSQQIQHELGV